MPNEPKRDPAIGKLLGDPDTTAANPHWLSGPPLRLYLEARVVAAENTDEWRTWREKSERRRQAGRKVADGKRAEPLAKIGAVTITVRESGSPHEVLAAAIRHFNRRAETRYDFDSEEASDTSDALFLERITVNYLRHQRTSYDDTLDGLIGLVGRRQAYLLLENRVLDAISVKFPHLAVECRRQKEQARRPFP